MTISNIISTSIEKTRLIVKILGLGSKDIKNAIAILPFGIDSNPSKDYRAIYTNTEGKSEKILLGIVNKRVLTNKGELRLYAENENGSEVFSAYFKNDGTLELGGNVDNAVRFSKLDEQFEQFKTDFNAFVSAFNSHTHPTAAVGAPSPPTPVPDTIPVESTEVDIAEAKIDNIKTS